MAKKISLPVIILIIGAVIIGVSVFASGGVTSPTTGTGKDKIVCDVTIYNQVLHKTKITSVNCDVVGKCGILDSLSVAAPLGFLSDRGTITLTSGGDIAKKSYKIDEGDTQSFELSVCSNTNKAIITLKDEDNVVLQTKEVSL